MPTKHRLARLRVHVKLLRTVATIYGHSTHGESVTRPRAENPVLCVDFTSQAPETTVSRAFFSY